MCQIYNHNHGTVKYFENIYVMRTHSGPLTYFYNVVVELFTNMAQKL